VSEDMHSALFCTASVIALNYPIVLAGPKQCQPRVLHPRHSIIATYRLMIYSIRSVSSRLPTGDSTIGASTIQVGDSLHCDRVVHQRERPIQPAHARAGRRTTVQ